MNSGVSWLRDHMGCDMMVNTISLMQDTMYMHREGLTLNSGVSWLKDHMGCDMMVCAMDSMRVRAVSRMGCRAVMARVLIYIN